MNTRHILVAAILATGLMMGVAFAAEEATPEEHIAKIGDLVEKLTAPGATASDHSVASAQLDSEMRKLARIGTDSVGPILAAIRRSDNPRVQMFLLVALSRIDDRSGFGRFQIEELTTLMDATKDYAVRYWVVRNLAASPGLLSVPPLEKTLEAGETYTARIALASLVERKARQSADKIVPLLKQPDVQLRVQAAMGLKELGAQQHVKPLIESLADEDEMVRRAAVAALEAITSTSFGLTDADSEEQLQKKIDAWVEAYRAR